jgi:DNA-binding PadR family transcriptional regulator
MGRSRKPSAQTAAVLAVLLESPAVWRHGYELCQRTGLKAGSMYPILIRLADRGLLEAEWERGVPAGRPARHLYRLSGPGRTLARELARTAASETGALEVRTRWGGT